MTNFREILSGGDIRSDGRADDVVQLIFDSPSLIIELIDLFDDPDDLIRGRAADAFEKVARVRPTIILDFFDKLKVIITSDPVPMVRWHLAMALGYLPANNAKISDFIDLLFYLLNDDSVFVLSWVISSLTIIAKHNRDYKSEIINNIESLRDFDSKAIKVRVKKALNILKNNETIPKSWIKSNT